MKQPHGNTGNQNALKAEGEGKFSKISLNVNQKVYDCIKADAKEAGLSLSAFVLKQLAK